jgi:hypothetical protein
VGWKATHRACKPRGKLDTSTCSWQVKTHGLTTNRWLGPDSRTCADLVCLTLWSHYSNITQSTYTKNSCGQGNWGSVLLRHPRRP